VPLGIALGRSLWDLVARQINVVPEPAVPGVPVILIALGAQLVPPVSRSPVSRSSRHLSRQARRLSAIGLETPLSGQSPVAQ
jgi:hypothetical protein